jgi:hypothetical protein
MDKKKTQKETEAIKTQKQSDFKSFMEKKKGEREARRDRVNKT